MRFLITAGPTRQYIDPVRFISNASTGRMGYALAAAAVKAGHDVTLISGPSALEPPRGARTVGVETGRQMLEAVRRHFPGCDRLIMAAAVCDYEPRRKAPAKIKKGGGPMTLRLRPAIDILAWAGRHKKADQAVIGFALEDSKPRSNAERKLRDKNLDMIVANAPAAIGAESAEVQVKIAGQQWRRMPKARKAAIAERIIRLAETIRDIK
jgi:phosphopantothenoylcysteine decarboxylase/phosphopantothenate--cysteine ligase